MSTQAVAPQELQQMYRPQCPRLQSAFLLMEIQENETVMKGRKIFKGYAKLQRIIEYLVNYV